MNIKHPLAVAVAMEAVWRHFRRVAPIRWGPAHHIRCDFVCFVRDNSNFRDIVRPVVADLAGRVHIDGLPITWEAP